MFLFQSKSVYMSVVPRSSNEDLNCVAQHRFQIFWGNKYHVMKTSSIQLFNANEMYTITDGYAKDAGPGEL